MFEACGLELKSRVFGSLGICTASQTSDFKCQRVLENVS